MFSRGEPSMVQRAFTSNRYLFSMVSHSLLLSSGPVYSMMNLPFLIGAVAKTPRPVRERPTRNGLTAMPLALPRAWPLALAFALRDVRTGMPSNQVESDRATPSPQARVRSTDAASRGHIAHSFRPGLARFSLLWNKDTRARQHRF